DPNTCVVTHMQMREKRDSHTATKLTDGRVFIAGGRHMNRPTERPYAHDSTEIFDPANSAFTVGPMLTTPRFDHSATLLPDGRVLLLGGMASVEITAATYEAPVDVLSSGEIYDPATNTINAVAAPMLEKRYGHTAVVSADNAYVD